MKLIGLSFLLVHFVGCFGGLTLDDLVEDTSWVPVKAPTRRAMVPNDELLKLEEGLMEATRRVQIGEIEENGPVDCFGLNPLLQFAFRWMSKPTSQKKLNTRYFLLTRENPAKTELKTPKNGCFFGNSTFKHRRTIIIVHGYMSDSGAFWMNDMANALLEKDDHNVILVDWGGSWKYWSAVANTRVVGSSLAQMLAKLIGCGMLQRSQIHCIGHSLGSHICSFAARNLGPLDRITGLDPAEPCFHGSGLNSTDAKYVDVIHTNTAVFGRLANVGVKDFYPNGGDFMPGCMIRGNVFFDKLNLVKQLEGAICSHGRSYEYFIDSLRNRCKFWGRSWDFTPNGSLTALDKECSPQLCAPLGLDSINYPGSGGYYVPTTEKTPFCIPDPHVSHTMDVWQKSRNGCASNKIQK